MRLEFLKMHGCGNDFLVCDTLHRPFALEPSRIRQLAHRHFGVGFDQLLVIEPPLCATSDFALAIYNCDGSNAGHCGNGARCVARYVLERKLTHKHRLTWDLVTGEEPSRTFVTKRLTESTFEADMGVPVCSIESMPLGLRNKARQLDAFRWTVAANDGEVTFTPISLGNPHAVVMVEDLSDVEDRLDEVNLGFCQPIDRQTLKLRVIERGVGETLACGSGACAATAAARLLANVDTEVRIELPGGTLEVEWRGPGHSALLRGSAEVSFRGTLVL